MARVTATGVEAESLSSYVTREQTAFRDALGQDLDVSAESPQGQLMAADALTLAEVDEAVVAVGNGLSLPRSLGVQLDDLGSVLDIDRRLATYSTVTATLTGTATTVVPAGSRARTAGGAVFALVNDATIGADGNVMATMRATETGPVEAAAGALTETVDLVAGWTGITNAAAASVGRNVETDVAYRGRYQRHVARNARTSDDAILVDVREVDGVVAAIIRENVTTAAITLQGATIGAGSFLVVVDGGADADVAAAIAQSKPSGVVMSGTTSVNVPHATGGHNVPVRFSRVTRVPLEITIDTAVGVGFPAGGEAAIIERVVAWAAGEWSSGEGDFDTSGLAIGEQLDTNRLLAPILSVPGHTVQSVTAVRRQNDAPIGTVQLTERLTIAAADVTVT
ncbi:MAG: baseplate J/gp47 family protein [Chloroflexi bacterium]|nr:baseplate J/gp47 family protein [Chloroflexota bacterium]